MSQGRPIVLGGGLAGLAACLELARAGRAPLLLERRRTLGGRASSFPDPASGRDVDNCQHVLLGSCTELLRFYGAIGVADRIAWRDAFHLAAPGPSGALERAVLRPSGALPDRWAFLPSLLRFRLLKLGERITVARVFGRIARLSAADLDALESESFGAWLERQRLPRRVVTRVLAPVVVSALNESIGRASARAALHVLRELLLSGRDAARLGIPRVPLGELYDAPAGRALEAAGAEVRRDVQVSAIVVEDGAVRGVVAGGARLDASEVILAVSPDAVARLLPADAIAAEPSLRALTSLRSSPIVGAHFFFEPDVALPEGELALLERTAQWIFDRHAATGRDEDRGHLAVVVSAAHALVDRARGSVEADLLEDVRAAVPSARSRSPRHVLLVKERHATFSAAPGAEPLRPGASTSVRGLFLASDACATGWPASMEGAVRAGRAAAAALLGPGGAPSLERSRDGGYLGSRSGAAARSPIQEP